MYRPRIRRRRRRRRHKSNRATILRWNKGTHFWWAPPALAQYRKQTSSVRTRKVDSFQDCLPTPKLAARFGISALTTGSIAFSVQLEQFLAKNCASATGATTSDARTRSSRQPKLYGLVKPSQKSYSLPERENFSDTHKLIHAGRGFASGMLL